MRIIQQRTQNFNVARVANGIIFEPDVLILHTTGATLQSNINWLGNPFSQVSYHFIIDTNGDIHQFVPITGMAWHSGTRNGNGINNNDNVHSTIELVRRRNVNANVYSIGVGFAEMADSRPTEAQLNSIPDLYSWLELMGVNIPINRQHIVGHHEVTPRTRSPLGTDVGINFPFNRLLTMIEQRKQEDEEMTQQKFNEMMDNYMQTLNTRPASGWAVSELEEAQRRGITDGTRPQAFVTREQSAIMALRATNQ